VCDSDAVVDHETTGTIDLDRLCWLSETWGVTKTIVSSVVSLDNSLKNNIRDALPGAMFVDTFTPLPIENLYSTPGSLGIDRLCAAVGANYLFPSTNLLVIDAGTAITIDQVNDSNQFVGGNISPGITTRFRALHHFTSKLPLVEIQESFDKIGSSTESAIVAGVQLGVLYEISSYIHDFLTLHPCSKIIITGGDAFFFEKNLKYTIFVEPFLVQKGLNRILNYNAIEN
jgi:type III pantothenate kinase